MKKKKYFVVLDHIDTHHNSEWTEQDVIQWSRKMAKQGHNVKVYEGELIKGFKVEIEVYDDDFDK